MTARMTPENGAAIIERLERELHAHMRGCTAWEYRVRAQRAEAALAEVGTLIAGLREQERRVNAQRTRENDTHVNGQATGMDMVLRAIEAPLTRILPPAEKCGVCGATRDEPEKCGYPGGCPIPPGWDPIPPEGGYTVEDF